MTIPLHPRPEIEHRQARVRRDAEPTPTVTRITPGRRYEVLGSPLLYLGQSTVTGLHWFEGPRGTESHADGWLQELMARGDVRPLGPERDPAA